MMDDFLNDIEREKIGVFVQDEVGFEAVKKVMLAIAYRHGVLLPGKKADALRNWALALPLQQKGVVSNEQLGADLRAQAEAINFIEQGFKKLEGYKPEVKASGKGPNPAI